MGCGASKKEAVSQPAPINQQPPVTPDKPMNPPNDAPAPNPVKAEAVQPAIPAPVPAPEQPKSAPAPVSVPEQPKAKEVDVPKKVVLPQEDHSRREKEFGSFSLPEVDPKFDDWAAEQLMVSPDDAKDTDDFKYLTFTQMPPFTAKHCSALSETLSADLFNSLKDSKTSKGYSLSNGMQVGVLCPAVPIGFTCGDEECYEVFKEVVNPIIKVWHGFEVGKDVHRSELDASVLSLSTEQGQKLSKYVKSTTISAVRNLAGWALPAGSGKQEREEVEGALKEVFESFPAGVTCAGVYRRLEELTAEEQAELEAYGLLLEQPESKSKLGACGGARQWPGGRGVFFNAGKTVACWVNEEDHCRLVCRADFGHVQSVFGRFCELSRLFRAGVEGRGRRLMESEGLGFLAACPSNVGTGMRASMTVELPELGKDPFQLMSMCEGVGLQARSGAGTASVRGRVKWEIWNKKAIGCTEVEVVQGLLDGVVRLIDAELQLAVAGRADAPAKNIGNFELPAIEPGFDAWLKEQLLAAPDDVKDTEHFKYLRFTELPPFTKKHSSMMRTVLNPAIFEKLKSVRGTKTSKGYTLSNAMQAGVLRPRLDIGFTCGDEECYKVFADVLHPMINQIHGFDPSKHQHPRGAAEAWAPSVGEAQARKLERFVKATRVRGVRNIAGLALPAGTTREERAEVEGVLKAAFATFGGALTGRYRGLGEMSREEVRELQGKGVLFQSPGPTQVLEAAGGAREWPENRGLFVGDAGGVACWCNEEDHCKVIAMEEGSDVAGVYKRFCEADAALKAGLEQQGRQLMESETLGYLATCPSNVGTGMKVSFKVELPALTFDAERLDKNCRFMGLVLHGARGKISASEGKLWEISNMRRVGLTEREILDKVVDGVLRVIAMEEEEMAAIREAVGEEEADRMLGLTPSVEGQ